MSGDDNDALNKFMGLGKILGYDPDPPEFIGPRSPAVQQHVDKVIRDADAFGLGAFVPTSERAGWEAARDAGMTCPKCGAEADLLEQRDAAKLEAETWSARATEAEAEVGRLRDESRRLLTEKGLSIGKVISVEEINAPLTAEIKRLTELVHQLNRRISQRSDDVDALTHERDALAQGVKDQSALREQHMKRADELTQNLKQHESHIETLQEGYGDLVRANDAANRKLELCSSMRSEIDDVKSKRDWFENRCKELVDELELARKERDHARHFAKADAELREDIREQRAEAEARAETAEQRVHDLEIEAIERSNDVTALVRALARAEDEIMVMRRTRASCVTS